MPRRPGACWRAVIHDGGSSTAAAKLGGVGRQTVRDWVLAFNAEGPPGLVNGKAPGNAPLSMMSAGKRCGKSLRADRYRRFTAWCAGG